MAVGSTKVVQVTNIAPQATKDQMQVLFGYLGKIEDIRLYPTVRDVSVPVQSRICYIKFTDSVTVGIAQHMTNTVFIDRALIVIPVQNGDIPDEYYALEMTRNGTVVPGLNVNEPKLPPHVVNSVHGSGADQVILTTDSTLDEQGLPNYPPLPSSYDSAKVEETRRTILVQNIDPTISSNEWILHFTRAGEVKYLRTCRRTSDNSLNMLIEFTEQPSVVNALQMNETEFRGNILQIQHATQPIDKPQAKSNEAAQQEIEEALTRFKEAQNMINASIEPVIGMLTKDKKGSRRTRSRSRSRDRKRRRSSRSRSRKRSRSRRRRSTSRKRSRSRERRRRSRSRRRTRSRSRKRSRSRGKKSRSRSHKRSRSRDAKKSRPSSRERSKDRKKSRDREKSRDRDRSKDRKARAKSKSKEKSVDSKERKSESLDVERKRSRSKSRSRSRKRSRSRDKRKERRRSRSKGSRRRTPSLPRSKKKSRSRSRDRDSSRKKDKKEKKRSRSRSKSKEKRSHREKDKGKSRSKSRSRSKKKSRSVDPPEKGHAEGSKPMDVEDIEKDSGEKSDNMDISNSP